MAKSLMQSQSKAILDEFKSYNKNYGPLQKEINKVNVNLGDKYDSHRITRNINYKEQSWGLKAKEKSPKRLVPELKLSPVLMPQISPFQYNSLSRSTKNQNSRNDLLQKLGTYTESEIPQHNHLTNLTHQKQKSPPKK